MGFFACYLLTPVAPPQRLRCTYVGFTVSPTRRIRQHNGELVNGAKRTTKHRPWEMVVVVHGFPSKFHALQFEYAWQHPYICRFTKERMLPLKGTKGLGHPKSVKRKLVELHEMVHVAPWVSFPLTITYTNMMVQNLVRTLSYFKWPSHMTCEVRPLAEFAHYQTDITDTASHSQDFENEDDDHQRERAAGGVCCICDVMLSRSGLRVLRCYHVDCRAEYHALCLADHFLLEVSMFADDDAPNANQPQLLRPEQGTCPDCSGELLWPLLVKGAPSNASTTTRRARVKSKPSKKRRRVDEESTQELNGNALARDGDAYMREVARSPHKAANAGNGAYRSSQSAADSSEVDLADDEDAGWFDDDISTTEYLDDGVQVGGGEARDFPPSRSPRDSYHLDQIPAAPMVVDLTLLDD